MTRRSWLLVTGAVAMLMVAVVAIVAVNPFAHPAASGPPVSVPSAPSPEVTTHPGEAPAPPPQGAYLGAWVGPDNFTQASEILAVNSLQQEIGRKLSIVHTYVKWHAAFPTPSDLTFMNQGSTLLISWAAVGTQEINSGADDSWIRTRAEQIKALGKPVFLEWRWEMDRPNLRSLVQSGPAYIAAWDRVRSIFAAAGVRNAAWVWCPTAAGFSDGRAAAYYPGDNEVDWICADAYPQDGSYASFASTVQPFLTWASHHRKPVMIGEFGVPQSYSAQQRAQWLQAAEQIVQADHQIKAMVYFDADPTGQGPDGRYSLGSDGAALAAFRSIARQPYFNPR